MHHPEGRAFARRLLVIPLKAHRSRMTTRGFRLVRVLVTCAFIVISGVLAARVVFALLPGSSAALVSQLLARFTAPLTGPFAFSAAWLPVSDELAPLLPVTVAFGAVMLLHSAAQSFVRALARPRARRLELRQTRRS